MGSFGRIANGNRIGNGIDAEGTIPWQVILNVNYKAKFAQVSIFL